ncbi:type 4 pilus major pilin [Sulfitobacter sp. 1A13353]|uniref:type 4 pilus major pilin n=1 Tax=Sulfitobacter sp. 1A13353 TaxID=3368568 RepID=UPI003745A3E7
MKKLSTLSTAARKRGISLIEAVLYLVIALAVIVGGIVFFQQAQLSNQVTDTARAGVGISSQVRGLYQSQRSFGEAELTGAVLASGSVPSNFQSDTGIVHPFGGDVTVNGNGGGFAMTFVDMSEAACLRLATVGEGGEGPLGTGIEGLTIADDNSAIAYSETTPAAPGQVAPVTAADAAANCADDVDVTVFYTR